MTVRINHRKQTVDVPHPLDESIIVTAERMGTIEKAEFQRDMARCEVPILIDGQLVTDSDGKPLTRMELPIHPFVRVLRRQVKGWKGLKYQDDTEIPFDTDSVEVLFDEGLMYPNPDFDPGKEASPTNQEKRSYWMLVFESISDIRLFDTDPKA